MVFYSIVKYGNQEMPKKISWWNLWAIVATGSKHFGRVIKGPSCRPFQTRSRPYKRRPRTHYIWLSYWKRYEKVTMLGFHSVQSRGNDPPGIIWKWGIPKSQQILPSIVPQKMTQLRGEPVAYLSLKASICYASIHPMAIYYDLFIVT